MAQGPPAPYTTNNEANEKPTRSQRGANEL